MATTDDFLSGILPDVPGCPLPTVRFHVHRAVMEFCRESGIWHEDLTPIDLVTLAAGQWCELTYSGTAWDVTAAGSL